MYSSPIYLILAVLFAGWLLYLARREHLQELGRPVRHPLRDAWQKRQHKHDHDSGPWPS
jgi:hypothetical protein